MTNAVPTKDDVAKKINRTVVKYVAVRLIAGVGTAVVGSMIASAIDRKLNDPSDESTDSTR